MGKTLALPATAAVLLLSACADHTASTVVGPQAPSDAVLAANTASGNDGLVLHPDGFGQDSYAAWRAHEGLQDSRGSADHALYFQKMTTTATVAAGVARIMGLDGRPLSAIVGLSWEHRIDGWCGAGAPRWDIIVSDASGDRGVIFLGCAAAVHTPGSGANWIRDSYPAGTAIASLPATGFTPDFNPSDALTISELLIVFDEGTDVPANPGFVFLDNITVNGHVFTGPADNGN
ncbi:MAG: hypothetical protein ACJ77R_08370 [Gemmatimonadaceae bacterium]